MRVTTRTKTELVDRVVHYVEATKYENPNRVEARREATMLAEKIIGDVIGIVSERVAKYIPNSAEV